MSGSAKDDLWVTVGMTSQGRKGPLYECIGAWSKCLVAQGRKPPYVYYFTRASRRLGRGISLLGTLVYVRHAPEMLETHAREDAVLSGEILDTWTGFRRYGEPGKSWKPYDHVQVFDLPGEKNTASRGG